MHDFCRSHTYSMSKFQIKFNVFDYFWSCYSENKESWNLSYFHAKVRNEMGEKIWPKLQLGKMMERALLTYYYPHQIPVFDALNVKQSTTLKTSFAILNDLEMISWFVCTPYAWWYYTGWTEPNFYISNMNN